MREYPDLFREVDGRIVQINRFDFGRAAQYMEALHADLAEYSYELRGRIGQVHQNVQELETRIDNLKKGIKPYPAQVMMLKKPDRIRPVCKRVRKSVVVPIFAELLEVRDPKWQNAVEGYLDRQKFYLLVPEAYYDQALRIYQSIRKEEKVYDAGIVDLKKLRESQRRPPVPGSLAEEIQTEDASARLYADYLLGSVIKCDTVSQLNRNRIAITADCMLYKNYVARKINPARYQDPFIGRRSAQIQIENLTKQLEGGKRSLNEQLQEENR